VVDELFKDGDHVPEKPLVEMFGRGFKVPPEQIGATGLKVIALFGFTVMVKVVVVAHCPASGVKV